MAQNRGAGLLDRLPDVDLIVGTQKFHRVPDYLDNLRAAREAGIPLGEAIVDTAEEAGSQNTIRDHLDGPGATGLRLRLDPAGMQHGLLVLHRSDDARRRAVAPDGRHRDANARSSPRAAPARSRSSGRS